MTSRVKGTCAMLLSLSLSLSPLMPATTAFATVDVPIETDTPEEPADVCDPVPEELSALVAAADENDTVTLVSDVELTETLVIDKALTIDLNGHTISADFDSDKESPVIMPTSCELTLVGEGTITTAGSYAIGLDGNGSGITVDGPTVHADGDSAISLVGDITNDNEYHVTMRSGELSASGLVVDLSADEGTKFVDISGGSLTGENPLRVGFVYGSTSAYIPNTGAVTISGGTFESPARAIEVGQGVRDLSISGGEFYGNAYLNRGECTNRNFVSHDLITGGTFYGELEVNLMANGATEYGSYGVPEYKYEEEYIHHPFIAGGTFLSEDGAQARPMRKKFLISGYTQDMTTGTVSFDNEVYFEHVECTVSPSLDESLALTINVGNLPEDTDPADYVVKYWVGDQEDKTVEETLRNQESNTFKVDTVAAPAMGEEVHVRVYYSGQEDSIKTADLSIRDYCDQQIDESGDEGVTNLCQSVLDYGAYSQKLFGYKTNDLANKNHADGTAARISGLTIPDDYAAKKYGDNFYLERTTTAIALKSQAEIHFYFTPKDRTYSDSFGVMVDGVAVDTGVAAIEPTTGATVTRRTLGDGRIYVSISGIAPRNYDHAYNVTINIGEIMQTHEYSVLSYAHAVQNDKKETLASTAKALYGYHLAAEALA